MFPNSTQFVKTFCIEKTSQKAHFLLQPLVSVNISTRISVKDICICMNKITLPVLRTGQLIFEKKSLFVQLFHRICLRSVPNHNQIMKTNQLY